ncbi:MAG: response regulator [Chloroflexi bacterium]|nr:response regulator [Chloroflexota bacterium]
MVPGEPQNKATTRHLGLTPDIEPVFATSPGQTGPLDLSLPWVVEFRIVGTATTLQVQVRDAMILGRGDVNSGYFPEVDLTPFDAFSKGVSRRHAVITIKNNRLSLRDLNSTNGTRINGVPCEPGAEKRLRHGDELQFGHLRMQMSLAVVPSQAQMQTSEIPAAAPQTQSAAVGAGRRVLIVEHDVDVGSVFKEAMENAGFLATLVNDVTKGLGYVFQSMPDAIVLDMMLPDMNGLDLVRYVRRQKTDRRIPVVVIGGGATGGFQVNQAREAGADIVLNKPVAVAALIQALSTGAAPAATANAATAAPATATAALPSVAAPATVGAVTTATPAVDMPVGVPRDQSPTGRAGT